MLVWVTSVVIPVGVSLATSVVYGVTVGPRLAARNKRVQAAHDCRDQLNEAVLDLLALCSNLEIEPFRALWAGETGRRQAQQGAMHPPAQLGQARHEVAAVRADAMSCGPPGEKLPTV